MEKNREEIRRSIIEEFRANEKRLDAVLSEIRRDPIRQKFNERVILDWNDGVESLLGHGVSFKEVLGRKVLVTDFQSNCIFCNFPKLTVPKSRLTDCIFSHCGEITVEDGTVSNCLFSEVENICFDDVKVYDSLFENLSCDSGDSVIFLADSSVLNCLFSDVRLRNGSLLMDGVGDCSVEKCDFRNLSKSDNDGDIFSCSKVVGNLLKRNQTYDMVDRKSCRGLDDLN